MSYNITNLLERLAQGEALEYLLFWGHTGKANVTTAACFSQWWLQSFVVEGLVYPTAEHWMMAQKAVLFNDNAVLEQILACEKPADVKALGRKVANFDPEIWDQNCFEIVVTGNLHKFSQHPDLKAFLLKTNPKIIVEASPFDAIWGIGMGETHVDARNPHLWRGTNLLGFALMEVRDKLEKG
jgi:ribA/ribD-fused uncharacterized protein